MSMMLLTPTTPLMSVSSPSIQNEVLSILDAMFICSLCVAEFHSHTARLSSGSKSCMLLIVWRTFSSKASFISRVCSPSVFSVMLLMVRPLLYIVCTVA